MEDFVQGIGENLAANILAAIIIAIFGWLISVVFRLPFAYKRRRRLFTFFGVNRDNFHFMVYLSTLFILPGGSSDFRGVRRSFFGPTIPAAELSIVQPVAQVLAAPYLTDLPMRIRKWMGDKVHWSFRELVPTFAPSPDETSKVVPKNMLTVGSQYYNSAADLYTETSDPFLKMEEINEKMVISVKRGPRAGDRFEQRPNQPDDLAILEKLYDKTNKTTIFLAAGVGVVGTLGAVQYLLDHWDGLFREYGTNSFAVCLRFQDLDKDPFAHRKPVVLSKFT